MNARTVRWTRASLAGSAIAVALLATACSSSGSGYGKAGAAPSGTSAAAGSVAAAGGSAATIGIRRGSLGSYLADATGRSLYQFTSDGTNASSCTGTCLTYWPALAGTGKPTAASGVNGSLLASFTRSDGAHQLSYADHPLYYFALDSAAGDTKGQGLSDFGALWWLVAPSGMPITGGATSAPSSAAGSSSGSGAGYGGGGYGG